MKRTILFSMLCMFLAIGTMGCDEDGEHSKGDHPKSEHPSGSKSKSDHPSGGDHPDHPR